MNQWKKKKQVRKRYDLTVDLYEARYEHEQKSQYDAILSELDTQNLGVVLDVGCGTGLLFERVDGRAEYLIGVDISNRMLAQAKETAKRFQNVHLVLCDADNLPFCEGTFDTILAVTLIQNMPDPRMTLSEMKHVAKANTTIVVSGLKRVFSKQQFHKLLGDSGFNAEACEDASLACFVALCRTMKWQLEG